MWLCSSYGFRLVSTMRKEKFMSHPKPVFVEYTTSPAILEALVPELGANPGIDILSTDPVNYEQFIKSSKSAVKRALAASTFNQEILGSLIKSTTEPVLSKLLNRFEDLNSSNQQDLAVRIFKRAKTASKNNVEDAILVSRHLSYQSFRSVVRELSEFVEQVHFKNGFVAQFEKEVLARGILRAAALVTKDPAAAARNHEYMEYSVAPLLTYAMSSGHDWPTISKSLKSVGVSHEALQLTLATLHCYLFKYPNRLGFLATIDEVTQAIEFLRDNVEMGSVQEPESTLWCGVTAESGSWEQRLLLCYNTRGFAYPPSEYLKAEKNFDELHELLKKAKKHCTGISVGCSESIFYESRIKEYAAHYYYTYAPKSRPEDSPTVPGLVKPLNTEVRKKLTSNLTHEQRIESSKTSVVNEVPLIPEPEIPQLSPEVVTLLAYEAYNAYEYIFRMRKQHTCARVASQWGLLTRQAGRCTPALLTRMNRMVKGFSELSTLHYANVIKLRLWVSCLVADPSQFMTDPLLDMPWYDFAVHGEEDAAVTVTRILDVFAPEDVSVWHTVSEFFSSTPEGMSVKEVLSLVLTSHGITVDGSHPVVNPVE